MTLQARVGRKWRTFKQLRTDLDGSFAGIYSSALLVYGGLIDKLPSQLTASSVPAMANSETPIPKPISAVSP